MWCAIVEECTCVRQRMELSLIRSDVRDISAIYYYYYWSWWLRRLGPYPGITVDGNRGEHLILSREEGLKFLHRHIIYYNFCDEVARGPHVCTYRHQTSVMLIRHRATVNTNWNWHLTLGQECPIVFFLLNAVNVCLLPGSSKSNLDVYLPSLAKPYDRSRTLDEWI